MKKKKKTFYFPFCTSTSNNGNQNKKKSGKLIYFFYCSLWSDFSVSCFCYVVNRPRPLFAQPWFQFIQPLESQPLWWPSPLLALALLKRPFSHSGTYFCILMFFRIERKKICTKKNACFSSNYLLEACWKKNLFPNLENMTNSSWRMCIFKGFCCTCTIRTFDKKKGILVVFFWIKSFFPLH